MEPATKKIIQRLLTRPIAYHPILARICDSLAAGVLLSQLIYWSDRGESPDGWIYKTDRSLRHETAITRHELLTAKRQLLTLKFIRTQLRGWPAVTWYEIDWDNLEYALTHDEE